MLVQDGGVSKIRTERAFCIGHARSQVPKRLEAHATVHENAFSRGFCSNFECLLVGEFRTQSFKIFFCFKIVLSPQRGCVLHCKHFVFSDVFAPESAFGKG